MPHTPDPGPTPAQDVADALPVPPAPEVAPAAEDDAVGGGLAVRVRPPGGWSDDAGDVPGWVLVTLMTAALVVGLWALAGPALTEVFQSAIERVTSSVG